MTIPSPNSIDHDAEIPSNSIKNSAEFRESYRDSANFNRVFQEFHWVFQTTGHCCRRKSALMKEEDEEEEEETAEEEENEEGDEDR